MRKANLTLLYAAVAALFVCGAATSFAADPPVKTDRKDPAKATTAVADHGTFRSSKVIGMKVRNSAGEDLGKIKDLVVNLESGKIRYAALSFGGFLGLGDKLFAVPMSALKFSHADNESHFVLNVDKNRLKNAPGFSEDAWPDFANPAWGTEIDQFYGTDDSVADAKVHEGTFLAAKNNGFTMTNTDGKGEHAHRLAPKVRIMVNGAAGKLADIKTGSHIKVTTDTQEGQDVVVDIEARSPNR